MCLLNSSLQRITPKFESSGASRCPMRPLTAIQSMNICDLHRKVVRQRFNLTIANVTNHLLIKMAPSAVSSKLTYTVIQEACPTVHEGFPLPLSINTRYPQLCSRLHRRHRRRREFSDRIRPRTPRLGRRFLRHPYPADNPSQHHNRRTYRCESHETVLGASEVGKYGAYGCRER
jgi:hypothetical protein